MSETAAATAEFDLLEPIGRGGLGVVWLARHRATDTPVALKAILAERSEQAEYQRAFRDEVRAFAALNHPRIVPVLDYGRVSAELAESSNGELTAGTPFLVMEYLSAGALNAQRVLPWSHVRAVLLQLLEALAHSHAFGLIHRDIKPANVLISSTEPFAVKLTDFGIAVQLYTDESEDPSRGASSGTPSYMSPEQFTGAWRDFGPWTDFYAIGCLGWELSTGHPPFRASTVVRLAQQHTTAPLPAFLPRSPVPPGFEAWLGALLEKNPRARPAFAADALAALLRLPPTVEAGVVGTAPTGEAEFAETILDPSVAPLDPFAETTQGVSTPEANTDVDLAYSTRPSLISAAEFPADGHRSHQEAMPLLPGVGAGIFAVRTIPLVDRQEERSAVWRALTEVVASGNPKLLLLRGGAGVGKTRFAMWLARRAHELGAADLLRVTCAEHDVPGQGLRRALAGRLHLSGLHETRAQTRLERRVSAAPDAEFVAQLLTSWLIGRQGSGHATLRDRLQAVAWLLRDFARQRALVLVVDDLQWGIELQGLLVDVVRGDRLPILIVATVRDESVSEYVAHELEELAALEHCETVAVAPLAAEHTRSLVQSMVGAAPGFVERVCERCNGNPLFAVELVGEAIRQGLLVPAVGGFQVPPGVEIPVSDDVQQIFRTRLAEVEAHHWTLGAALEIAAVLGGEWSDDEWRGACAHAGIEVSSAALDSLVRSGLADFRESSWSFRHPLLADVLQSRAAEEGRLFRWHEEAAWAVREFGADGDMSVWDRTARHLVGANRFSEALPHLTRLGEHLNALGEFSQAEAVWRRWFGAAESAELPAVDGARVGALLGLAWSLGSRGDPRALEDVERAEALAQKLGDDVLLADVDFTWSVALYSSDVAGSAERSAAAVRRYRAGAAPLRKLAGALRLHGRAVKWRDPERGVDLYEEALEMALIGGDEYDEAKCLVELARALFEAGRPDRVAGMLSRAQLLFEEGMSREGLMICAGLRADLAIADGRFSDAEAAAWDAMAHAQAIQQLSIPAVHALILVAVLLQGDCDRAAQIVDERFERIARGQRAPQVLIDLLALHLALVSYLGSDVARLEAALKEQLGATDLRPGEAVVRALQKLPASVWERVSMLL